MKIFFWAIGKTSEQYLRNGIDFYCKKIEHYASFSYEELPSVKSNKKSSPVQLKKVEGESILSKVKKDDFLILLDEKGKTYTSRLFSEQIDKWQTRNARRIIFLVGGAYGFSQALYERADAKLSLSSMTFSHQMVRLFFLEQLYRAYSIQRNEPYHND